MKYDWLTAFTYGQLERPIMRLVLLCRDMNWSWQTLQDQPQFFIDDLIALKHAEAEYNDRQKKE